MMPSLEENDRYPILEGTLSKFLDTCERSYHEILQHAPLRRVSL